MGVVMADAKDHWQALFDHKFLRWFDLKNEPALCEIVNVQARVELTMPGGAKSRKPVIHLRLVQGKVENAKDENGEMLKTLKPLVLNTTNGSTIASIHGPQPSQWIGKQIVLFETTTRLWNSQTRKMEEVPCIRIRKVKAK